MINGIIYTLLYALYQCVVTALGSPILGGLVHSWFATLWKDSDRPNNRDYWFDVQCDGISGAIGGILGVICHAWFDIFGFGVAFYLYVAIAIVIAYPSLYWLSFWRYVARTRWAPIH
jgi:hypothetical protein